MVVKSAEQAKVLDEIPISEQEVPEQVPVTVYYLERKTPPKLNLAERVGVKIVPVEKPTVTEYREMYNGIGSAYYWLSRRKLSDEQLESLLHHPQNLTFILEVDAMRAGLAELDARDPSNVELVQFGLLKQFHGRGLGTWFLQHIIEAVWSDLAARIWLHTCSLDHPAARSMYEKSGFVEYKREEILREL